MDDCRWTHLNFPGAGRLCRIVGGVEGRGEETFVGGQRAATRWTTGSSHVRVKKRRDKTV